VSPAALFLPLTEAGRRLAGLHRRLGPEQCAAAVGRLAAAGLGPGDAAAVEALGDALRLEAEAKAGREEAAVAAEAAAEVEVAAAVEQLVAQLEAQEAWDRAQQALATKRAAVAVEEARLEALRAVAERAEADRTTAEAAAAAERLAAGHLTARFVEAGPLGLTWEHDERNRQVLVRAVTAGGQASKVAGLRPGLRLTHINGGSLDEAVAPERYAVGAGPVYAAVIERIKAAGRPGLLTLAPPRLLTDAERQATLRGRRAAEAELRSAAEQASYDRAAEQERVGRKDKEMAHGTIIGVAGRGRGVYLGFKKKGFPAPNEHTIEFETIYFPRQKGGVQVVRLREEQWQVVPGFMTVARPTLGPVAMTYSLAEPDDKGKRW
jgi:hypothetical protein